MPRACVVLPKVAQDAQGFTLHLVDVNELMPNEIPIVGVVFLNQDEPVASQAIA